MKARAFLRIIALAIAIVLLPLYGCTPEQAPYLWAKGYTDALIRRDYGKCYSLLSGESMEKVTLQEFVERHEAVYGAMEIETIGAVLDEPVRDGTMWRYSCTLTYDTAEMGSFQQRFMLTLSPTEGGWAVEWSPKFLFEKLDWGDSVSLVTLYPSRGEILDSKGWTYAVNTYAPCIYARPANVESLAFTAQQLSPMLEMDSKELIELMTSERAEIDGVVVLKSWQPGTLSDELRDAMLELPGIEFDDRVFVPIRHYPGNELAAHIVGYTGFPTEAELAKLDPDEYTAGTRIGKTGLEAAYEATLHGKTGKELRILDEKGSVKDVLVSIPKQDGLDLQLTLDHTLQARAVDLLAQIAPGERGAVVVLDPKTGAVQAMASAPTFDANIFTSPIPNDVYQQMTAPENGQPFLNRATQGGYAPGSTIKPLMGILGIETNRYNMNTKFSGKIVNNDGKSQWTPPSNWPYPAITRISDYSETPTMQNAIIKSDNIYFASLALDLGWELVEDFLRRSGFAEAIPFDLPVLTSKIFAGNPDYGNRRLLANTGYGQGELIVSPLQLASILSLLANEGAIMQPRLVSATRQMAGREYTVVDSFPAKVWKPSVAQPLLVDAVSPALKKVMTEGSGRAARIEGLTLLGKTGTAEVTLGSTMREIAWLAAYTAPDTGYDRLVLVMLETDPQGGAMRHEIVKQLLMP